MNITMKFTIPFGRRFLEVTFFQPPNKIKQIKRLVQHVQIDPGFQIYGELEVEGEVKKEIIHGNLRYPPKATPPKK